MDELLIKASLCRGRDACHCKTLLVLVYSLKMQETAGETHHVQGLKPFYRGTNRSKWKSHEI